MILNNKVSQRLEIIGFKGAVKKSTSRIQVDDKKELNFLIKCKRRNHKISKGALNEHFKQHIP